MKFKLVESYLIEDELLEDKMVKFGGELSPKYGWCVIYIGGPGSGKGTATNLSVNIEGHKFDPDDLKKDNIVKLLGIDKQLETPIENRRLDNPQYVSELHTLTEPIKNKVMQKHLDMGKNYPKELLPNIIFDIVGSTSKFEEIIPEAKEMGYKVAIVWTLTSVEKAWLQNLGRKRKVDKSVLLGGHTKVIKAVEELFDSKLLKDVDDFWVIDNLNSVALTKLPNGETDPKSEYAYRRDTNVYHVKTTPNGFEEFENIIAIVDDNKEYLRKNYNQN